MEAQRRGGTRAGHDTHTYIAVQGHDLDGLDEDTEGIVHGALGLVKDVAVGAAQDDGRGALQRQPREAQYAVLADHDLLDEVARAQLDAVARPKVGRDLGPRDQRQALNALELGVLDRWHKQASTQAHTRARTRTRHPRTQLVVHSSSFARSHPSLPNRGAAVRPTTQPAQPHQPHHSARACPRMRAPPFLPPSLPQYPAHAPARPQASSPTTTDPCTWRP